MEERVILVDENDAEQGTEEKLRAHADGRLHRAVSVFVRNAAGEVLLQRRAATKYHSAGQWTNAACSHPRPGEPPADAARRRLREEMGVDAEMVPAFTFLYRAEVGGGLVEHELDHVFVARHDGDPRPDPAEVDGWRWASLADARADAARDPEAYTPWFRLLLEEPRLAEAVTGAAPRTDAGR